MKEAPVKRGNPEQPPENELVDQKCRLCEPLHSDQIEHRRTSIHEAQRIIELVGKATGRAVLAVEETRQSSPNE
jgi:hypothetical protein